mmetsp:Transcript_10956/g.20259  ORF Transcript_10956/g.20259 Transcript_10956/m.20259 type:complete len:1781 (-) Transcript_10956:880-6222(-)
MSFQGEVACEGRKEDGVTVRHLADSVSRYEVSAENHKQSIGDKKDMNEIILEGWLDKCGQKLMFSKYTHRWCVLNGNSFTYYTDESKSVQKMAYVIDDTCKVYSNVKKNGSDSSSRVITLERPSTLSVVGYELLLTSDDPDTLTAWEVSLINVIIALRQKKEAEALHKKPNTPRLSVIMDSFRDAASGSTPTAGGETIDTKPKPEKRPSFFRRRSTLKANTPDVPVDTTALRKAALKDGTVSKRGQGESDYSSAYCVLSSNSLTFFESSSMEESKGMMTLDASWYLTRVVADKKVKSTTPQYLLSLHTRGSGKNFINKSNEMLLSFPNHNQMVQWEDRILKVLAELLSKVYDIVVRVQLLEIDTETLNSTSKIDEPIFHISLYVGSKSVMKQYHHYIDIREVREKIKTLSSGIITATFPRVHKRSQYNQKLTDEEVENRMVGLQSWLQDVVSQYSQFDYLNFLGGVNDVQVDIAGLFGTTPSTLKAFIKESKDKKAKEATAHLAPPPLPKSKVMSLFEKYEEIDEEGTAPPTPPAPSVSVTSPETVGVSDDDLRMPSTPDKLVLYNIVQLAKLCKIHEMDCTEFKSKKDYVNALATTYQKAPPYLHNKEARPIVENLLQTIENKPSSINDHEVNIEIDKIFIDLMRKLNVAEGLLGLLSMEFNTFEKLDRIESCVAIWDRDLFFTREDSSLLQQFTTDRYLDSFSVLNLSSRLARYVAEGGSTWLNRWCMLRGIPAIISRIDTIVEQDPLEEVDAVTLLQLLKVFRTIMDSGCRNELVCTRGAVEAVVRTLSFEYKALAIESLNLLSDVILFGGPDAPWQMINALKNLAHLRKERFFEILVEGILDQDVSVQGCILKLINLLLMSQGDINDRVKLRSNLHELKFEEICKIFKNEYSRMAKVPKGRDAAAVTGAEGLFEVQVRDKIDRLLFGGARKIAAAARCEEEENEDVSENNERTIRLRPGVLIAARDFGPGLAEDYDSRVHPEKGIMEGHIVAISKKSDGDDESGFRSWDVVKNVARRLSLTEAKSPPPDDDQNKYERNWYELHDNILSWFNLADKTDKFRERLGSLDISRVIDILDFSSLTTRVKVPFENMFSLVLCDEEEHFNFYLDSLETKHKWMLAIRVVQKRMSIRKCAFRLPLSGPLESSATLALQNDFELQFSLYEAEAKTDIADMYATTIADAINPGSGVAVPHDPVSLVRFIDMELKKHRNTVKLKSLMSDIAEFVNENYAPKEEIPEEDEEDEVKVIHPLAVPDSDRPIAQAPPLPFIPEDKKPRIPNKKVKQLFWTKVKPVNVWKSVWEGMTEPELTWTMLDDQFGEIVRRRKAITASSTTAAANKPKEISLFDGKRTQNAAIACGKLRKTPEEIFDLIVNLDPDELSQEINETILNLLLPTDEEMAALRAYTGKVEDLDFCGRLFSYLSEIERLESRLRVQHVMLNWHGEASVVFEQLNTVKLALQELNDPEAQESFEILLSSVLAAGNYMNGKGSRGQAHGYKLDILPKLRNIKQVGFGKKTLLHFIIGQCKMHFHGHIAFYERWNFMWKSPKVILKNLENIMTELKSNLDVCVTEIEAAETIESEQCRTPLVENLGSFITQASGSLQELRELYETINKDVRFVKNYFGETSVAAVLTSHDDDPWCSFFSMFVNFANMHRLCSIELEEWEKAEERIRKNALAKQAKMSSATAKGPVKSKASPTGPRSAGRHMDNVAMSQAMASPRERVSSSDSSASADRRSRQTSSEGTMVDMFKKKMLVMRKKANAENDFGDDDSDESDCDAW